MAAVVDEGDALGGVIDEYFAFIYEEPTEEDAVSSSSERDLEELDGGSALDEDEEFQRVIMPSASDLLLQNGRANGGSNGKISNTGVGKETRKFPEKFHEKFQSSNEIVFKSPVTAGDSEEGGPGVVLSKHSGAQNFPGSSSSSLEGAQNSDGFGSASKRLKTEFVSDVSQELNGVRVNGALDHVKEDGASVKFETGEKLTPSISINISPSLSSSNRASVQSGVPGTTPISSSTTYIGGSTDKTAKSIINLSTHLPAEAPWTPEFRLQKLLDGEDSRNDVELRSADCHSRQRGSYSINCDFHSSNSGDSDSRSGNNHSSSSGDSDSRSGDNHSSSDECISNSIINDSYTGSNECSSIYINGNHEDDSGKSNNNWNSNRSSSVYLNGKQEKVMEYQFLGEDGGDVTSIHTAAVPVSIKVPLDSSSSPTQPFLDKCMHQHHQQTPKLDLVLEKFLQEIQHPRGRQDMSLGNTRSNPDSAYQVNNNNSRNDNNKNNNNDIFETVNPVLCGKGDIVCDYINSGITNDKVLDVESIECDILDELFEGMRVKNELKERLNKSISSGDGINNNDVPTTLKRSAGIKNAKGEMKSENVYDLVASSTMKLGNDSVVESNEDRVENTLLPNEDCSESLVQSWQYIAFGDNRANEENLENSVIEKSSKPIALEAMFNSKNEVDVPLGKNVGHACPSEGTCKPGECESSKGKCNGRCVSTPKDSNKAINNKEGLVASLTSKSPPLEQVSETSPAPPIQKPSSSLPSNASNSSSSSSSSSSFPSSSSTSPDSYPLKDIAQSLSHPESCSLKSSLQLPSSSSSHTSSSSHLSPLSSSKTQSSPSEFNHSANIPEKDSSFSSLPLQSNPVHQPSDPLSVREFAKENNPSVSLNKLPESSSFTPQIPSRSSSPSPPSSQPHSLSSLPPNLSPITSHVNFFTSQSPLSFNPPSLELPEILTPTPTTSDYFPDTECDRSDYYSWQEVGGAVGGLEGKAEGRSEGVEGITRDSGPSAWHLRPPAEGIVEEDGCNNNHHTSLDVTRFYDMPAEEELESDDDAGVGGGTGLAAAVSRVVRRSMRRMRRLRLSGRKSPTRSRTAQGTDGGGDGGVNGLSNLSEETEVRRALPAEPSIGLATVRSPAAASIIVTSLVAALAPPPLHAPREVLDPPPANTQTDNRHGDGSQTTNDHTGASRRHRRRQRRPWGGGGGGGGGGGRERGREGRGGRDAGRGGGGGGGRERRLSHDLVLDSHSISMSPSAPPTSLEVEVGGYAPTSASAPVSLVPDVLPDLVPGTERDFGDYGVDLPTDSLSPSAPPSLELILPTSLQSWETAAVIPRPSITHTSSSHRGRRSSSNSNGNSSSNSNNSTSNSNNSSGSSGSLASVNLSSVSSPTHSSSSTDLTSRDDLVGSGNSSEGGRGGDEEGGGGGGSRTRLNRGNGRGGGGGEGGAEDGRGGGGGGRANETTPRNVILERRRQRRRGNTTNDTNNNNSNNNNNRNYTTTDAPTPPSNNRTRNNNNRNNNNARQSPRRNNNTGPSGVSFESERLRIQGGTWSHQQSGLMASLAVTVTTFNISRFAVLGAKFGWPFVVQWVVISIVLGLPLMTFHVTVGQYLGAGVIDMWRISPIFQGVGYSLVVAQALVGVYCCVPVAWLFIFFRDSFITHNNMFRWADCRFVNCSRYNNFSTIIIEGVPKYFNSQVLQRSDEETSWLQELGSIKFDMAVNIALIWIITLIALSRGNRSYGRVAYIVFLLPLLGYLVVCLYIASWTKYDIYMNLSTNINELFRTSQSWMAASREVFLVWGFHGAVLQQMSAHNKKGHPLYRDTTVLAIITFLALVLAAVTGSSCVSGLHQNKLYYKPSSFENTDTAQFLSETNNRHPIEFEAILKHFPMVPPQLWGEYMHHDNFYAGIRIRPPNLATAKNPDSERSGYQSLRLGTELFPALLAVNGAQQISPFWSSLFYFSLLLFGIAQQLAVWRTVVEAVIRINRERLQAWEIFITFLCCLFGFSAALPMATGAGIQILYFLDYVLSCGWWLMIIQLVQIFALLFVRGKPYSGQDIVGELMGKNEQCRSLWLGPLTSFSWNIIVPVGLLVLSISSFKSGQYRDVFDWGNEGYWPVWVRQLASALQLFPILLVPLVGLIQTCRYLTATDDDLFEKIQLLYRPSLRQRFNTNSSPTTNTEESDVEGTTGPQEGQADETLTPLPYSDPPPKYTPPPSYSTATGVRFAKLLNHSLRRSMRRLRDTLRNGTDAVGNGRENEVAQENSCSQTEESTSRRETPYIPPPDYVTVVGECDTRRANRVPSQDPPPMYATLDPLRRQRALAAVANATTSTSGAKTDAEIGLQRPTTPVLQRNGSTRGSGLRRSIASGVRRSARRLAATLGVRNEDDPTLVNSEEPPGGRDPEPPRDEEEEEYHPHAYTNFEMISQSEA